MEILRRLAPEQLSSKLLIELPTPLHCFFWVGLMELLVTAYNWKLTTDPNISINM